MTVEAQVLAELTQLVITRGEQLQILQDIVLIQKKMLENQNDMMQEVTKGLHILSECIDVLTDKVKFLEENAHA